MDEKKSNVEIQGNAQNNVITTGSNNRVEVNYGIKQIINFYSLNNLEETSIVDLGSHIISYLNWIIDSYGIIDIRGIKREGEKILSLPLDEIYVPLEAETFVDAPLDPDLYSSHDSKIRKLIEMSEVLDVGNQIVITGGPGSGKTTILLYIARTLAYSLINNDMEFAKRYLGKSIQKDIPFPVYVPLSAYADYLQRSAVANSSTLALSSFIPEYLIKEQASIGLPKNFFEQLIRHGTSVILLLDGLDEVPNESNRSIVRSSIEKIVSGRNNQIRVVATCRTAAYEGRTSIGKGFQNIRILNLQRHHIESIIQKVYKELYKHNITKAKSMSMNLIKAIDKFETIRIKNLGKETEPLIVSPLLVRMILITHYNNHKYLSSQRVELYKQTTEIMIYSDYTPYDYREQIEKYFCINQAMLKDIFRYIAFQMHILGDVQGREITEERLRGILQQVEVYKPYSESFLALIKLRHTLIEERLGKYRFVHLAFQEYLTAQYLAEIIRTQSGIKGVMQRLVNENAFTSSWWREPILLLVGYLGITVPEEVPGLIKEFIEIDSYLSNADWSLYSNNKIAATEIASASLLEFPHSSKQQFLQAQDNINNCLNNIDILENCEPYRRERLIITFAQIGDNRNIVNKITSLPLCFVPEGEFFMGSDAHSPREKPTHPVTLDNYWISQYPITNSQYQCFIDQCGYMNDNYWKEAIEAKIWDKGFIQGYQQEEWMRELVRSWMGGARNRPSVDETPFTLPNHPVIGITWYEALAFTRWVTELYYSQNLIGSEWYCTLPTEAEWEKAARGGVSVPALPIVNNTSCIKIPFDNDIAFLDNCNTTRNYPWGNRPEIDKPNKYKANYNESGINSSNGIGIFPGGQSPYGCMEMCGNVFEWTRSAYFGYPYSDNLEKRECNNHPPNTYRIIRGGYFGAQGDWLRVSYRKGEYPLMNDKLTGFRVVVRKVDRFL